MKELFKKELPKWSALVVKGKPVTKEQAQEILIRTASLSFCTNDREFEEDLNNILYEVKGREYTLMESLVKAKKIKEDDFRGYLEYRTKMEEPYELLNIVYLKNSRIASSWIGGPYGWCDWNGRIYSSNYNIGKCPCIEDVYKEWVEIAEAFPYLDLKCQLMNTEAGESESIKPVIEFSIKDGKVQIYEPKEILDYPMFVVSNITRRFSDHYAERGCTIKMFKDALDYTKSRLNAEKETRKKDFWVKTK